MDSDNELKEYFIIVELENAKQHAELTVGHYYADTLL